MGFLFQQNAKFLSFLKKKKKESGLKVITAKLTKWKTHGKREVFFWKESTPASSTSRKPAPQPRRRNRCSGAVTERPFPAAGRAAPKVAPGWNC